LFELTYNSKRKKKEKQAAELISKYKKLPILAAPVKKLNG